ncbi:MAG: small acid-soluble spore protein Tlp [Syntrophomonas sp.]
MKNKPDDRSDNVEKIQKHINDTVQNIDAAEEMIALSDNPKTIKELKSKNRRREAALDSMRAEIRDEAQDRERE